MPATSRNWRTVAGLAWLGLGSVATHKRERGGVKVGARTGRLPRPGNREDEEFRGAVEDQAGGEGREGVAEQETGGGEAAEGATEAGVEAEGMGVASRGQKGRGLLAGSRTGVGGSSGADDITRNMRAGEQFVRTEGLDLELK